MAKNLNISTFVPNNISNHEIIFNDIQILSIVLINNKQYKLELFQSVFAILRVRQVWDTLAMALKNRILTMVVLAVGAGAVAAFGADRYLTRQTAVKVEVVEGAGPQAAFTTIVGAARPLRFGSELSNSNLVEIPWPEEAIPQGAFSTIEDVLAPGRRVALTAIELNEPILKPKITGPDGKAGLANIISKGMRAVTIRVNDVAGVAGFVLPGDRVDVVWTRDSDHLRDLAMTAFTSREEVAHIETELIFEHVRSTDVPSFTDFDNEWE